RWLAYMLPCRRFADVLADACARLGADVGRYSFIAVDFHHILLAGLPAHSLALRPAHSRRHLYVTCYTEGFSHFASSMTAPVGSDGSVRRVGLAPTGKRRLLTAHTLSGHSRSRGWGSQLKIFRKKLRPGRTTVDRRAQTAFSILNAERRGASHGAAARRAKGGACRSHIEGL